MGRTTGTLGAIAIAAAVALGPGCRTEEQTVEPAAWADEVCDAFQDYIVRVGDLGPRLGEGLDRGAGTVESQRLIAAFLHDAVAATEQLVDDVEEAGTPDVDGGSAVADRLRRSIDRSQELLERARRQARRLPVDDPRAFEEQVDELSLLLNQGFDRAVPTIGGTDDRLESLLGDRPACRRLGR